MAVKFTADQQKVIDLRNCNILVSAAAGSGKTAVLVERIAQLVSDPKKPVDIDKLLVVTFTNAAAAQMKERLFLALSKKAEEDPGNEHLQRQLTLIYNAQITTIDSFCLYLIRNHFNDIGLDPDFRTADDGEMKLLRQDVLSELLEEKFAQKDPAFLACVECFVPGGRESRLEEMILQLYEYAMSYPFPEEWLRRHQGDYDLENEEALKQEAWFWVFWDIVRMTLKESLAQAKEALVICRQPDGPYMYAAAVEADLALAEQLMAAAGLEAAECPEQSQSEGACQGAGSGTPFGSGDAFLRLEQLGSQLLSLSFARLGTKKDASVSEEKREQVKKARERFKSLLLNLRDQYFYAPPKVWIRDMRKASGALRELAELALLFMEKLDAKKREKNLIDFSDMEHMALRILLDRDENGSVVPSKTALEYRKEFHEILIDEYQDSNLVQEFLLQSISGEDEGRYDRFMVGDVKQSIYKFRLARPELFMEKFDSYQKEAGNCIRVDLKQNFRSRHEVTDCVNDVFARIMHRGLGGVEYDRDAALYPAAQFPEPLQQGAAERRCGRAQDAAQEENAAQPAGVSCYEPEFLVALEDGTLQAKQPEACMVADRIRRLVGKLPVRDKETGALRPASYKDIVILLRTTAGWDEVFKKVLEEKGIPAHVTSKTGYFAAPEVQAVLNFLRILNNPLQDIPMFGVLHSGIGQFSDEEIACLRAFDDTGKRKLYDCLKLQAQKRGQAADLAEDSPAAGLPLKCAALLAFLKSFREYAVFLPIHALIQRLFEETDYLYTAAAMPGGSQRRANLEMLLARAESFEKTSYSGLFHFIRYVEQMEKYNVDYGESGTLDENADVVRIMSIHKSKGLEFPVCFVSGLSKRFNRQDARQPVIMDMDLGLAADCVDIEARTRRVTLKKNVLAHKLLADSMGEELRVLYVAMTRAEEKLILTASCKADAAPVQQSENDGIQAVSPARLMEAGSFYDMLLPVWQAAGRTLQWVSAADFLGEELSLMAREKNARQRLESSDPGDYLNAESCRELTGRLNQKYRHEDLAELFVKTTVSELKKAGMQEEGEASARLFEEEEIVPYLPKFVREEEECVTGTLRGSAYHRLLELFPLEQKEAADWTLPEIQRVMEEKVESGALTKEYSRIINPGKILAFLRTPLAARMKNALARGTLRREQPFVLGIPARQLKASLPEDETVLIQGIIDVFFEEEDGLVLADYKTDAVKEARELANRYQVQLDYYAQALERLTGKRVKEKIIFSFALEEEILLIDERR